MIAEPNTAARRNTLFRSVEFLLALALSLALAGLHVIAWQTAGPLWRDEVSSLTLATKPTLAEAWRTLVFDPCPGFFFILLRSWHGLVGDSDAALRLLGLVIGVGIILAFWWVAFLTTGRSPLLALLLVGFSPTLVLWGDSLRGYGIGIFCILIVFGCFWRVLQRPTIPAVGLAALFAILSVHSLFSNALLLFAVGSAAIVIALKRREWTRLFLLLGICLVAAASLLPYRSIFRETEKWSLILKTDLPLGHLLEVMAEGLLAAGPYGLVLWIVIPLLAVALTIGSSLRESEKRNPSRDLTLYAVVTVTLGVAATFVFFKIVQWPTNVWYYLPLLALVAIAMDTLVDTGDQKMIFRSGAVAIGIVCLGLSLPKVWSALQERATDVDVAAQMLKRDAQPGDLVVIYPFAIGITYHRHADPGLEAMTIPPIKDLTLHRWDEVIAQMRNPHAIEPVLQAIHNRLKRGLNVWIIFGLALSPGAEPPPQVLSLGPGEHRPLMRFLGGWSRLLAFDVRSHAVQIKLHSIAASQPIRKYEEVDILQLSGWKE